MCGEENQGRTRFACCSVGDSRTCSVRSKQALLLDFMCHNGEISGVVEDSRHRRSPIPSGGLEVKLKLKALELSSIR